MGVGEGYVKNIYRGSGGRAAGSIVICGMQDGFWGGANYRADFEGIRGSVCVWGVCGGFCRHSVFGFVGLW